MKEEQLLKVVAQLTISPRIVSLVAEEDLLPFKKGQVVKRINIATLKHMERPLNVIVNKRGGVKIVTK